MKSPALLNKGKEGEMEALYKKYANFMDGYSIFSSQSIYIPFYKVRMKMSFTVTSELSLLEEFICQVISLGVVMKEDIVEVLSLDIDIFDPIVESLEKDGLLVHTDNEVYSFTSEGEELFQKKRKHEKREDFIAWYYDGIREGFKMDHFSTEEEHKFYKLDDIDQLDENFILPPRVAPDYIERDYVKLTSYLMEKIRKDNSQLAKKLPIDLDEIVSVENFRLLPDKEVLFHEYYLLLYADGYGGYKLLAHDPCGKEGVQEGVTEILEELLNREYLTPSIQEAIDSLPTIEKIILALKETTMLEHKEISQDEFQNRIEALERLSNKHITLKYIMDYEIRRLFLEAVKTAQNSLYIISPWMNNYIVNDKFRNNIIRLLNQGGEIRIIYGLEDKRQSDSTRFVRTQKIARELMDIGESYGDQMKIVFGDTHEKVVIWDNKHAIIGSFNFLTYSAEDTTDSRHEGCIYTDDPEMIEQVVNLRFKMK